MGDTDRVLRRVWPGTVGTQKQGAVTCGWPLPGWSWNLQAFCRRLPRSRTLTATRPPSADLVPHFSGTNTALGWFIQILTKANVERRRTRPYPAYPGRL